MMKKNKLILVFLLFSIYSISQGTNLNPINTPVSTSSNVPFPGEQCASSYLDAELLRTNPSYVQIRQGVEQQLQNYIAQQNSSRASGVVYTIPVVFHIMHSGEAVGVQTNISYAQIVSCIAALNRDFRRTAADGGIANSGPLGVDAEIEFCMAKRDPSGNLTTGVTRHDMSGNQDYLDSGVYHTATAWRSDLALKSMVNWDHTKYMNVWVVNKIKNLKNIYSTGYTGGVQGYAYFPGAPSPYDGVVMVSSAVGNDPTGTLGYNLWSVTDDNRVFTHEIGHFLNLYHTFEGTTSCGGASGASCGTNGDRCCDTPPTIVGSGNYCDSNYCLLDNKENYMQYQNGACASDFTPNQVTRMRAVLAPGGIRNDLVSNNNCSAPPVIDLNIDTIYVPLDTICSTTFIPSINVCNVSSIDSTTSFDIKYKVDAGAESTFNWTGNLQAGNCVTISLPAITSTSGVHTFTARIDSTTINGTENDNDASNNSKINPFTLSGSNVVVTQNITACDSFVSPSGKTWKINGIQNDTLPNKFGCDSLLRFSLTINNSSFANVSITNCDSVISPSGKIYKTTGTYQDTIANSQGCDSLMTLNITISNVTIVNNPAIIACDSIQINTKWYYSSQNINDTIATGSCDTIKITPLTINNTTSSITTITVCDSMVSGSGKVYKNSGFFRDTMPNSKGCDSLVEYYLTVNKSTLSNVMVTACNSYTTPLGSTYTVSGIYGDTLTTTLGCDSVILTHLIIDTIERITLDTNLCFGDSIILSNGTVVKTTGTYYDTAAGSIGSNVIYSEDFEGATSSFTLNTNDTNAITPGASDNAWIINNSYLGGNVFGSPIVNTPNQDAAVTGNINSTYLHIHNRRSAILSFPSITNSNYIDGNIVLLGGQNGLNFSKMTNDISTVGKSLVSFDMYYLCRGSYGRLYYSLNSGVTWTRIGGQINNGGQNWSHFSLVDSVFANQPTLRFAVGFNNINGLGVTPGFAVDEIVVRGVGNSSSNCGSITTINLTTQNAITSTQSLTACDSLISPSGKIWKISGTYQDTIPSAAGCDSLMTINLTLSTTTYINQADTACDSLVWRLKSRTVSGLHYDTVSSIGCDTIYVLDLLINNSYVINTPIITCDSFTLSNGNIVYTNGVYADTLVSSKGCDSLVNYNVSITTESSSTITQVACGTYISPSGKSFTATGTYMDTIPNSGGCDSVISINLTILTATSTSSTVSACDNYTLPGGTSVTVSGIYRDTLSASNGCDSIIVTSLTLGSSSNITQTFSLCAGQTVAVGTNTYGATGIYRDTIVTALGCDSIINTNLLINPLTPGTITFTADMCQDAAPVTFMATPMGGRWGGPGIDSISGVFNPVTSGMGIHVVTYKGPGACGVTDSAIVEVFSAPTINNTVTEDECDEGSGEIDISVFGGTPTINYVWSTGETTEDLIGLKKGNYTLTVTDVNGCFAKETITVLNVTTPDCNYNIFVPNIFSPDGNGENDVLRVEGNGIEKLEFSVFNRWGNIVFRTTSPGDGWDGTYKGQLVNQGVFVYFVSGKFVDGTSFEDKGTVTVIRR